MAAQGGTTRDFLSRLADEPWRFDFFHAVRMLECLHPELPRVGYSRLPREDAVRFCQQPSMTFAPASISRFAGQEEEEPARLFVNFMGLLGPNGPMPLALTEQVVREKERDPVVAEFLDMFHHRMVSLFYRAWAVGRQTVSYDRADDDRFADYVGSLAGIGLASFRGRDAVEDVAKLHFCGHLSCFTQHAEGLCSVLRGYYRMPVSIREFIGEWTPLPDDSLCRLGASHSTGELGVTAVIGSRRWECGHKFRLRIGPVDFDQYERLLPGGRSFARLCSWVRTYAGDELAWEVQLVLKAPEVPQTELGRAGRLGWTTWLISKTPETDSEDMVLDAVQETFTPEGKLDG